jgi:hypothetical protein
VAVGVCFDSRSRSRDRRAEAALQNGTAAWHTEPISESEQTLVTTEIFRAVLVGWLRVDGDADAALVEPTQ